MSRTERRTRTAVHILLADASRKVLDILSAEFKKAGYHVHVAGDDVTAFRKAMQFRPDVVYMDSALPAHGAADLIRSFRHNPTLERTPVIAKLPNTHEGWDDTLREAGVTHTLSRPLKFSELRRLADVSVTAAGKVPPTSGAGSGTKDGQSESGTAVLRAPAVQADKKLDILCQRAAELGAFPFVVARALSISSDETSGASELGKCIQSDPGLAGGILKLANSPNFAKKGGSIIDVAQAIVRIGFQRARKAVLAGPIIDMFPDRSSNRGMDRVDFWLHSLAVACMASRMAKSAAPRKAGEAFMAGLLHDMGKLVLDECCGTLYGEVLEASADAACPALDVERELLGIGHPEIGDAVLATWGIPDDVRAAVRYHHAPGQAEQELQGEDRGLALAVSLADRVVKALGIGSSGDYFLEEPGSKHWQAVGAAGGVGPGELEEFYKEINVFREFLKLGSTDIVPVAATPDRRTGRLFVVDCHGDDPSLLDTLLQSQGYSIERLRAHDDDPGSSLPESLPETDLLLVRCPTPQGIDEYRELAQRGPDGRTLPMVVISQDPIPVLPEQAGDLATFGTTFDTQKLLATLDLKILGEERTAAPLLSREELTADLEQLRAELGAEAAGDSAVGGSAAGSSAAAPTDTRNGAAGSEEAPAPEAAASKILVVEDSLAIRVVLRKYLESKGYKVQTASGGEEALSMIAADPPDLLVLDIMMPDMDGMQMLRAVRSAPASKDLKVVVCTALKDRQHVLDAVKLGVAGYIVKPVVPDVLLHKVESALGAGETN